MSDEQKRLYSTPTLRELHPYTEDQIRADIQLVEESDLDDDVALALMRLAHALCGSSMLRGLIARAQRRDAIVQTIVERRAGGQVARGKQGDDGAMPMLWCSIPEFAAHCVRCSAKYSADEYAALGCSGCTNCGHYEVRRL